MTKPYEIIGVAQGVRAGDRAVNLDLDADATPTPPSTETQQMTPLALERQIEGLRIGLRKQYLIDQNGLYVAELLRPEYAPEIVKAVNSHDALVAALRESADEIERLRIVHLPRYEDKVGEPSLEVLQAARAALALVDEKGGNR